MNAARQADAVARIRERLLASASPLELPCNEENRDLAARILAASALCSRRLERLRGY